MQAFKIALIEYYQIRTNCLLNLFGLELKNKDLGIITTRFVKLMIIKFDLGVINCCKLSTHSIIQCSVNRRIFL